MSKQAFVTMDTLCNMFTKYCDKKGLSYCRTEEFLSIKISDSSFLALYYMPRIVIDVGGIPPHVYGCKYDIYGGGKIRQVYLFAKNMETIYKHLVEYFKNNI